MAYRTGKFSEAVHAFHICIVLSPETAECYYNRGLAYQELGDVSKAVRDYGQALKLNPRLTDAALNRGILFYRMGRLDDATSDLEQALHSTSNPAAQGRHSPHPGSHRARPRQPDEGPGSSQDRGGFRPCQGPRASPATAPRAVIVLASPR